MYKEQEINKALANLNRLEVILEKDNIQFSLKLEEHL